MRGFNKAVGVLVAVSALAAVVVGTVQAQQQGQQGRRSGFQGRGGVMFLLANPQVQEELKLNDEQKKAVETLTTEMQTAFQELANIEREKRQEKVQELQKKTEETVKKTLNAEQQARLRQIDLQVSSRFASSRILLRPDVAKELKITEEQQGKIKAIAEGTDKARADLRAAVEKGELDQTESFGLMRELGQKDSEDAQALLTNAQKEQWKTMLGKPFELNFGSGRRGQRQQSEKK